MPKATEKKIKKSMSKTAKKQPAKKPNKWVLFIRKYREKHPEMSYREVITSSRVKKLYCKQKDKPVIEDNSEIVNTADIVKNPDYAPKGYYEYNKCDTELTKINNDKALVKAKIKTLLDNGRKKITTKEELCEEPLGSLVSYITTDGLYRSGGFLRAIKDTYFALQGGTVQMPISFCVQFENIKAMYVGSPVRSTNRKKKKTNFPVKIGDKVVYYAKDNFDRNRFKATKRYKDMKKWFNDYGHV